MFLVRVFWLNYIFLIEFKIPILNLRLLPKTSVPFEGLYSSIKVCPLSLAKNNNIGPIKMNNGLYSGAVAQW